MNLKFIPVAALILSSCQTTQSDDPSSLSFKIPRDSTLTLNKNLEVPEGKTHALLQAGKFISERDRDDYKINCRFDVKTFGPQIIKPEVFKIQRTEDGRNMVSEGGILRFYSDVYLKSDQGTDVIKLACQQLGYTMDRTFTVAEMEAALDDYFTFSFP